MTLIIILLLNRTRGVLNIGGTKRRWGTRPWYLPVERAEDQCSWNINISCVMVGFSLSSLHFLFFAWLSWQVHVNEVIHKFKWLLPSDRGAEWKRNTIFNRINVLQRNHPLHHPWVFMEVKYNHWAITDVYSPQRTLRENLIPLTVFFDSTENAAHRNVRVANYLLRNRILGLYIHAKCPGKLGMLWDVDQRLTGR